MKNSIRLKVLILLFPVFISGCASGIKYGNKGSGINIPEKWSPVSGSDKKTDVDGWINEFNDENLKTVIEKAISANPDILIAAERVEYAKNVLKIAGSDLAPNLSGGLKYGRSQSVMEIQGKPVKEIGNKADLSVDLSWEIDLWGKIRALKESEKEEFYATVLDYESARLSYAGSVAKAWFSVVEAGLLSRLSKDTLSSFEKNETLIKRRFNRGLSGAMDLRLIRTERLAAREALLDQEKMKNDLIRALKVLMGEYPSVEFDFPLILPELEESIPEGLPSDLMKRRPDIAAAEKRIRSADFKTKAAERSLFPSISLTAGAGTSSRDLNNLLNGSYLGWNLGSGILMPIFQGGKLRADIKRNSSLSKEAWLNYRKVVLNSFKEAETAIEAEYILKKREDTLRSLVIEAKAALDKAWDSYLAGNSEIISILDSNRSVINARKNLISISASRLRNRVDLHLALGGSFDGKRFVEKEEDK